PIHIGHLFVASAVANEAGLDRVLFLPVGDPAHRDVHASAQDRQEMVTLAIRGDDLFALDETAIRQPGPVYTADTMPLLRRAYPNAELHFIAGADSLVDTPWQRLDEVVRELQQFFVVAREGADPSRLASKLATLPDDLPRRFTLVNLPLVDVSSTAIRERVSRGKPIRYLVPDPVARYIEEKSLYKNNGAG